jgi:hypothetical protein
MPKRGVCLVLPQWLDLAAHEAGARYIKDTQFGVLGWTK